MTGLQAAVDRIDAAIERKETILIYGDYDVDGTMAVIILKTAIELCGGAATSTCPTASAKAMTCVTMSSSALPRPGFA